MSESKPIRVLYYGGRFRSGLFPEKKLERLGCFIVALAEHGEEGFAMKKTQQQAIPY